MLGLTMSCLQSTNAFVVQFRGDADPASGELCGRVEHVLSGMTAIFQSVQELVTIFQHMLNEVHMRDRTGA
jgi:hypothetical protein